MTEPRLYENFDLQIEEAPRHGFRVSVTGSPTGEDGDVFLPPYSDGELSEILSRLATPDRDLRPANPTSRETVEQVGARLFEALFSGPVRHRWESSRARVEAEGKGLRLRLRFRDAPGFEAWPWELLFDPSRRRFLSQSVKTPVVRYFNLPTGATALRAEPPLRMLVVIAGPAGYATLDGEREWERLCQSLSDWVARGWLVLERLGRATLEELQRNLITPCHILHIVGHGKFDSKRSEGALLLEDDAGRGRLVTGTRLGAILAAQNELRLVVLNSCEGALTSTTDPFAGVAQALVGCRIPAVIAMRSRITDDAAIAFSEHFYGALGRNLPVDAALADARRAMFSQKDDLEWITPVLYTRSPDGHLFNLSSELLAANPKPIKEGITASGWSQVQGVFGKIPWPAWGLAIMLSGLGALYTWGKGIHADPNVSYMASNPPECPAPLGLPVAFVKVEAGKFLMGEKSIQEAAVDRPFCMGRFEVTQAQWKKIMGTNLGGHVGDAYPVAGILWKEMQEFLARLNARSPGANYRLPSNVQWEYAAHAGTVGPYSFDGDSGKLSLYGNCPGRGKEEGRGSTTWVGSFDPNPWGIFDMYGNVAEWVEDDRLSSAGIEEADTAVVIRPVRHTRRGGSFRSSPESCDSVNQSLVQDRRNTDTGFRLVRDLVQPAKREQGTPPL